MDNSSQGRKRKREILIHQVNGDSKTQILVEPIDGNFCWKKKVLILQLNFGQGSSTKERQLVVCNLVIVHHIIRLRFSYLSQAIKGRENSNLFFQEAHRYREGDRSFGQEIQKLVYITNIT